MNVYSSEPESLIKEKAHIVFGGNTEKKTKMQSANNQRALSYSNGAAATVLEDGCGRLILLAF